MYRTNNKEDADVHKGKLDDIWDTLNRRLFEVVQGVLVSVDILVEVVEGVSVVTKLLREYY